MNNSTIYVLQEVVQNIKDSADEVRANEKRDAQDYGRLLAYAEALSIIRDLCDDFTRSKIGLDFDIDEKYLY